MTITSDDECSGAPQDKRRFPRFNHRSKVRLTDITGRISEVSTRDLSHGGLFLLIESGSLPSEGEQVKIQALDIEDALEQQAEVVRCEHGLGIAIKFSG